MPICMITINTSLFCYNLMITTQEVVIFMRPLQTSADLSVSVLEYLCVQFLSSNMIDFHQTYTVHTTYEVLHGNIEIKKMDTLISLEHISLFTLTTHFQGQRSKVKITACHIVKFYDSVHVHEWMLTKLVPLVLHAKFWTWSDFEGHLWKV